MAGRRMPRPCTHVAPGAHPPGLERPALLLIDLQYGDAHPDCGYVRRRRRARDGDVAAEYYLSRIRDHVLPPTINLHNVDADCVGVDHVANEARRADVRVALSANYGLGGHNAVLALTKHRGDGAG